MLASENEEEAAALECVVMEAEMAMGTESEIDYDVKSAAPHNPSGEPEGCGLRYVDSDDTDLQPVV